MDRCRVLKPRSAVTACVTGGRDPCEEREASPPGGGGARAGRRRRRGRPRPPRPPFPARTLLAAVAPSRRTREILVRGAAALRACHGLCETTPPPRAHTHTSPGDIQGMSSTAGRLLDPAPAHTYTHRPAPPRPNAHFPALAPVPSRLPFGPAGPAGCGRAGTRRCGVPGGGPAGLRRRVPQRAGPAGRAGGPGRAHPVLQQTIEAAVTGRRRGRCGCAAAEDSDGTEPERAGWAGGWSQMLRPRRRLHPPGSDGWLRGQSVMTAELAPRGPRRP